MNEDLDRPETIVLVLRPVPWAESTATPVQRLRGILKELLRKHGFRCVHVGVREPVEVKVKRSRER